MQVRLSNMSADALGKASMADRPNLLLVEDDATSRRLLTSLLVLMGYDVTSAASGNEALLYLYSERACDAVVTDVIMPGMSGLELAKRARDTRPGLPIVCITGNLEGVDLTRTTDMITLRKPISSDRLGEALDKVLAVD